MRETRPIKQRHYLMSDKVQEEMDKQVQEMLAARDHRAIAKRLIEPNRDDSEKRWLAKVLP